MRYLSSEQIEELVSQNLYDYTGEKNRSRCFAGTYESSPMLPACSLPGGDIGSLAVLYAAARVYGFEVNTQKALKVFTSLIGSTKQSTFNVLSDHPVHECRYLHHVLSHPDGFELDSEALNQLTASIKEFYTTIPSKFHTDTYNKENACIILESQQGLYTQYTFESDEGVFNAKVLVFQKTHVDLRHQLFAKQLVENKALTLYEGLDEDYVYEVLSEMTDIHLMEAIKRIDPSIPIYSVSFTPAGHIRAKLLS